MSAARPRGRAWQRLRRYVIDEAGPDPLCGICGDVVDLTLRAPHPRSPSIDHVVPLARGGHPFALSNLRVVHLGENAARGTAYDPAEELL